MKALVQGVGLKKQFWLFWVILILAAFLRFYRLPSYMEFLGDQGRDVIIVRRFLTQGDLMFIGPQTSVGNMYLGPWYYYLMAPFLLLANLNPVGPAIMVALFGLATVWLIWRVGREWFDEKVGLMAALLMAVSPVVIYYSIFSWNPNIMPFFALLSIWLVWRIWQKGEYKRMLLLALSLAMVLNSHYLGLLLFPVVGIFLFLAWLKSKKNNLPQFSIQYSIFSILIFFVLMSPLALFDLRHNFANLNAFKQFFTIRQTTVNFKFYKGFFKLPEIFNQLYAQLLVRQDFWRPAYIVLPLILLALWRERKNRAMMLIGAWLLVGLLGLANYKQHVYAHYYGFLWPAAILFLATSISYLNLALFLPTATLFLYLSLSNWHGRWQPVYQFKRAKLVAQAICRRVQEEELTGYNLVNLASYNDFRALAYRYFLLKDCPQKPLRIDQYPQAKALFIVWEDPTRYPDPVKTDIWEVQSGAPWRVAERFFVFDTKVLILTKSRLDGQQR